MKTSKDTTEKTTKKYWAFISYRHADNLEQDRDWASWLHKSIETYDVPAELIGTKNDRGDIIPERIYPVFRDEESLPADADLANSITNALDNSNFLVALCSPRAVESKYVAQEIEHFKATGKGNRIIAAIIAGEPGHPENECFPEPIREVVNKDGKLSEPIAADFRLPDGSEGFTSPEAYKKILLNSLPKKEAARKAEKYDKRLNLMKLKIIAGILGKPLETIRDRDKAYQLQRAKKQKKIFTAIIASVSLLAFIAVIATFFAIEQKDNAIESAKAEKTAKEKTESALIESRFNEGTAWLERSALAEKNGVHFTAAMMAGRSIGYEGFGGFQDNEKYPILIDSSHPEKILEATNMIHKQLDNVYLPIWTSPTGIKQTDDSIILSVAYSPSGSTIATGSTDNTVRLWNTTTGEYTHTLTGHSDNVRSVAFSADGKTIVSASIDKTIRLWDVASGKNTQILTGHSGGINSIAISPDGKTIASGASDKSIRIWDVASGKAINILNGHSKSVNSVAYSPDGKTIGSGSSDKTIRLWIAATGQPIGAPLQGHSEYVLSIAFSSDDKTIASGSADKTIRLWNTITGKAIGQALKGHSDYVSSVAFSPDGRTIASGAHDETIKIWDALSGKNLQTFTGHTLGLYSIAFNLDGKTIASGAGDNTIRIWSVVTGESYHPLKGHFEGVNSAAFSPDGRTIASGSYDRTIKIWDAQTGKITRNLTGHDSSVNSIVFSSDGSTFVSGSDDKTIKIWDASSGKIIHTLTGHSGGVSSVALSPDGKTIASGSSDMTIRLWDTSSGKTINILTAHTKMVSSVAFSHDGNTLASGSADKHIILWDTNTGKARGHLLLENQIQCVEFSPDGNTVAAGAGSSVVLFDTGTGKAITLTHAHSWSINTVAFSPDGNTLATGSRDDTIKLWDLSDSNGLKQSLGQKITGHFDSIESIAFSPDGKSLLSSSSDCSIKLWDTSNIKARRSIPDSEQIRCVNFSPDGRQMAIANSKSCQILDSSTGKIIHKLGDDFYLYKNAIFSPDGKTIAVNTSERVIKLWDTTTGKVIDHPRIDHHESVDCLAFSPDSKIFATGSADKTIGLWNTKTGEAIRVLKGHTARVNSVTFSSDGKTIASGAGDTIIFWDTATGNTLKIVADHSGDIEFVAYRPDKKTLVSVAKAEVYIWDSVTQKVLKTFTIDSSFITNVALSPSGKQLAIGSAKGTVKILDLVSGKIVRVFYGYSEFVRCVAYSPDGSTIAANSSNNSINLRQANTGISPDLFIYLANETYSLNERNIKITKQNFNLYGETNLPKLPPTKGSLDAITKDDTILRLKILHEANNWHQLIKEYKGNQSSIPLDQKLAIAQSLIITTAFDWSTPGASRKHILFPELTKIITPELISTGQLDLALLALASHASLVKDPIIRNQYWPTVLKLLSKCDRPKTILRAVELNLASKFDSEELQSWKSEAFKNTFIKELHSKHPENINILRAYVRAEPKLKTHLKIIQLPNATDEDYCLAALIASLQAKNKAADIIFQMAHRKFPNNYLIHFFQGEHKFEQKDYPEALRLLKRTLVLIENVDGSPSVSHYVGLALAYQFNNQSEKATEAYAEAIEIDEKWANPVTVSDDERPVIEKDALLEILKRTLEKHPELKPKK